MVLWELTAITAYFLGLKRTYRLALQLQRRLVGPNHPRIRQFIHRRTRKVFDVAVTVHKNIQQRDIEVGRNLGNWILRRLDSMKPSAQIRGPPSGLPSTNSNLPKHIAKTSPSHGVKENNIKTTDESNGRMLFNSLNIRLRHIPTIPIMSEARKSAEWNSPCSRISSKPYSFSFLRRNSPVFRDDIGKWMLH
ncbi:uncharacterized protein LOC122008815 isoform X1 [Zingiber officinale]|uniref:Uncharacterized protein n=1 Tax=Zingiber officinale TaxID=94328 RepID=A0A8J5FLA6_ZINOF|nr:uncharacterized protein LOC122008815 isoform X1 [Zingiber officinale]KAG6486367.1 hypothetical protein ZIOFF_054937 [Zingiber officinale]